MNFSYSLANSWDRCQFLTKIERVDELDVPLGFGRTYEFGRLQPWVYGVAAHEAQALLLRGISPEGLPLAAGIPVSAVDEEHLVRRSCDMALRWWDWIRTQPSFPLPSFPHEPDAYRMIDQRYTLPMSVGQFEHYVIQPDLVTRWERDTLWDWKWKHEFVDDLALELDLQSVIYQHGLLELEGSKHMPRHIVWVQGLIEEPTVPKVTKKGLISRAVVRTSPEVFRQAVLANGQDPDEYSEQIASLPPFFKFTEAYRSERAVRALWRDVVVPKAEAISRALLAIHPFQRRLAYECNRCYLREECLAGITGGSSVAAMNTPWRYRADTAEA